MADWAQLLGGSVLLGICITATMVLPRPHYLLSIGVGVASLAAATQASSTLLSRYGTFEVAVASTFVLFGGAGVGYRLAAAALSHLARDSEIPHIARSREGTGAGIVLLAFADPERYSPSWVARRHERLTDSAGIDVPPTAVPFVFLAQKTRYRSMRGSTTGIVVARDLAARVAGVLGPAEGLVGVLVAPADDAGALGAVVAELATRGAARVGVVVLGQEDSDDVDHAKHALDSAHPSDAGVRVCFGPSLWNDTQLAAKLTARITAALTGHPGSECGVVLVSQGMPPEWERRHAAAQEDENYFNQRVRMLLGAQGIDERAVRIAWIDWQMPDVTEAVRHVAALGKTRVVVAPSTIALSTLEYELDLDHAIDSARLPSTVEVVTLPCWGTDTGMLEAIVRSARSALQARGCAEDGTAEIGSATP